MSNTTTSVAAAATVTASSNLIHKFTQLPISFPILVGVVAACTVVITLIALLIYWTIYKCFMEEKNFNPPKQARLFDQPGRNIQQSLFISPSRLMEHFTDAIRSKQPVAQATQPPTVAAGLEEENTENSSASSASSDSDHNEMLEMEDVNVCYVNNDPIRLTPGTDEKCGLLRVRVNYYFRRLMLATSILQARDLPIHWKVWPGAVEYYVRVEPTPHSANNAFQTRVAEANRFTHTVTWEQHFLWKCFPKNMLNNCRLVFRVYRCGLLWEKDEEIGQIMVPLYLMRSFYNPGGAQGDHTDSQFVTSMTFWSYIKPSLNKPTEAAAAAAPTDK